MRFRFTPQQEAFRRELREFLQEEVPKADAVDGFSQSFSKKLAQRGWIGLAWPKEYGGQGLGPIEQMIYTEEMILYDAPRGYHFVAERQVGPSIIRHGTEEQKREWIPKIINADVSFALGLSEPNAGSDLANVQTRAERDGDEYVVNGEKIWTSNAHLCDHIWLVVRTDPTAPKHRGISCLIADLRAPGVTIQPLYDMTGGHHFNQVFFENVRVPVSRRVGEENQGWYILAEHLDFERSGIERLVELERHFWDVVDLARQRSREGRLPPPLRYRIAELAIELEVGRLLCYRVAWLQSTGRVPNAEASMAKVFGTEWSQRVTQAAMNLLQLNGAAWKEGEFGGTAARTYLHAVSRTIAAGTSEIQRNIIATRGLGLPRS
ncbi:MAG: acyl-CoA dehydrogenase family protein [Chloroflexota bacterium]|nr:acyl-CoA dehydrogenase family protein [Dehalococcoidia bacterium]MDW8047413.1 acyl-CoA dehydrogenase family protein [Chloroflexota bacterium]